MSTSRAERLDALGDPNRRALLERLALRPCGVGELAQHVQLSHAAITQHLGVLIDTGLVLGRQEGDRHVYQIDLAGVGAVRAYFDRLWNQALAAVKQEAEAATDTPDSSTPPV